ncbi:helicase-exonuclease AddAB subunit AddA [Dorea sp.]
MGVTWTQEQQKVIDLRNRNILVSAAAGSGKTAVLVERIITMLTKDEPPVDVDRLLIVTFTEAAAAEMKERIRLAIEKKLMEYPDNEHLKQQATLIHNAQITTIHSFCLSVIRDHFHAIDIDPGFRIGEEGELKLLRHDVLEEVLEEKYQEGSKRFLDFASGYSTGRNDKKIEDLILKIYEFSRSYPDSEAWLDSCVKAYEIEDLEAFEESNVIKKILQDVQKNLEDAKALVEFAMQTALSIDGPAAYEAALEKDLIVIEDLQSARTYRQQSEAFANVKWARLPVNKDKTVSEEKITQVKKLREMVKGVVKNIAAQYFYETPEAMIEDMNLCAPAMEELADLVRLFGSRFEEKKRSQNMIDFSDMEQYALRILTQKTEEGFVPSPVALEYQKQYQEIMIDEYQDSNLIQEAILTSVSTCRSGRYNIFMVGDVKQSIYRFRLSKPELFLEKFYTYNIEESQTQRIDLHKNFRSRKEVLESVNAIFGRIMTEKLGGIVYDDQAALYPGAEYPENENLNTEIYLIDSDLDRVKERYQLEENENNAEELSKIASEKELEARAIAMRIRELLRTQKVTDKATGELRNAKYSDIVILTRSVKGFADVFTEVLNREGIPTYAGTSEGYFRTQEIGVLLDYLRTLDNRRQDIPLTAVLTSPFCGLDAEELAKIKCFYPELPFYEAVVRYREDDEERKNEKDEVIRTKISACLEQMDAFRRIVPFTPMHELLWKILEDTGYGDYVAAMPGGQQRKANLEMLIEKARAYESTSYKGLFHFVRYIEQLQKYDVDYGEASIEDEHADTVRVMTIHKSKGLEFPIVIVAGMGKRFNMQDARSAVALHAGMGVGLDAVDLGLRTKSPSIVKKVIQKEEVLESLGEELRVLYVALTRAKEKLIITGTLPRPEEKLEESRMLQRSNQKELSFGELSHAGTYWDWILPAVLGCGEDVPLEVNILHFEDIVKEGLKEETKGVISRSLLEKWDTDRVYEPEMHTVMEEQFGFHYPYEKSSTRKLKFTVTELKKRAHEIAMDHSLEEEAQEELLYEEPEVTPLIPTFMQKEEGLTGAPRGTAYHRIMELLAFEGPEPDSIEAVAEWIDGMAASGKIEKEAAECVKAYDIFRFLETSSGKRMKKAAKSQKLWKEQPFVLGIDAKELYPEEEDGELILVQGIIDAYFEEEDGLVVLDYKTDRVRKAEELVEKYQEQLRYYAKALEQMTGKKVKEKIIYAFSLGKEIRI